MILKYRSKTTEEQRKQAVEEYLDESKGLGMKEVGQKYGVSPQSIFNWVKKYQSEMEQTRLID